MKTLPAKPTPTTDPNPPNNPAGATATSDASEALAQPTVADVAPAVETQPVDASALPPLPRARVREVQGGRAYLPTEMIDRLQDGDELRVYRGDDRVGLVRVVSVSRESGYVVTEILSEQVGAAFTGIVARDEVEMARQRPVRPDGVPPGDRGAQPIKAPAENRAEPGEITMGRAVLYCFSEGHERPATIVRVHPEEPGVKGRKVNVQIALDGREDDGLIKSVERSNNQLGDRGLSHVRRQDVPMSQDGQARAETWRWPPRSLPARVHHDVAEPRRKRGRHGLPPVGVDGRLVGAAVALVAVAPPVAPPPAEHRAHHGHAGRVLGARSRGALLHERIVANRGVSPYIRA